MVATSEQVREAIRGGWQRVFSSEAPSGELGALQAVAAFDRCFPASADEGERLIRSLVEHAPAVLEALPWCSPEALGAAMYPDQPERASLYAAGLGLVSQQIGGALGEPAALGSSPIVHDSVEAIFEKWNAQFEGAVPWMYADILGFVTTGVGNLIDPVELALELPWQRADGSEASAEEIREEWERVKRDPASASKGHKYSETRTSLRLSNASISALIARRLREMAETLAGRFPGFADWPADAQLATLSMSWAMGPGFKFPKFEAAIKAGDFAAAAEESAINATGNPGVIPRNAANKALFLAAAEVKASGADPSILSGDYTRFQGPPGDESLIGGERPAGGGLGTTGAVLLGLAAGGLAVAAFAGGGLLAPFVALGALADAAASRVGDALKGK